MKFEAEIINGKVEIKPIIEKKDGNIIVHLPSLELINKFTQEVKNGKRNI